MSVENVIKQVQSPHNDSFTLLTANLFTHCQRIITRGLPSWVLHSRNYVRYKINVMQHEAYIFIGATKFKYAEKFKNCISTLKILNCRFRYQVPKSPNNEYGIILLRKFLCLCYYYTSYCISQGSPEQRNNIYNDIYMARERGEIYFKDLGIGWCICGSSQVWNF